MDLLSVAQESEHENLVLKLLGTTGGQRQNPPERESGKNERKSSRISLRKFRIRMKSSSRRMKCSVIKKKSWRISRVSSASTGRPEISGEHKKEGGTDEQRRTKERKIRTSTIMLLPDFDSVARQA